MLSALFRGRSAATVGATAVLLLVVLLVPLPAGASTPVEHRVELRARTFAFEPARIQVNRGDRVFVTLHSDDVVHGLYIDGYGVDITAEPGKPAQASFVADRVGKFRYRCSVSCGALHPFMIGELVVGPNTPFWRAVAGLIIVATGSLVALSQRAS